MTFTESMEQQEMLNNSLSTLTLVKYPFYEDKCLRRFRQQKEQAAS